MIKVTPPFLKASFLKRFLSTRKRDYGLTKFKSLGGEQEWRGGESAYHSPFSIPPRCNMWVKYVVGSHHAVRVPLSVLCFNFLHKEKKISKFQFHQYRGPALKPRDFFFSLNIVILSRSSISEEVGLNIEIKLRFQSFP